MRNALLSLFVSGVLFSYSVHQVMAADWNKAPACVLEAALSGIPNYLDHIPPQEATSFGFSSATSFAQARSNPIFGTPLLLRTITPTTLRAYTKDKKTADLLSDMQLWYVPVLEAGRVIAFLVVEQSDRFPCQAVSFGYTRLAAQFEEALLGSDKRDMAVLVAVFQAREHFLAFPDLEPDRLYSLNSFEVKKQQSNADVLDNTLDAVVMRLIPVVNASIKQGEELP